MLFRALVLVLAALAVSAPASAVTFGFHCITNNSASNCAIGEAQMTLEVTNGDLIFRNLGPAPSAIMALSWESQSLIFAAMTPLPSADFEGLEVGYTLPGGDALVPPYVPFDGDSASTDGLDPGESYGFFMIHLGGDDAFLQGLLDGSHRIGIEVQGFAGGGSESFINNIVPIPEPGSAALVAMGMLMLARRRRSA